MFETYLKHSPGARVARAATSDAASKAWCPRSDDRPVPVGPRHGPTSVLRGAWSEQSIGSLMVMPTSATRLERRFFASVHFCDRYLRLPKPQHQALPLPVYSVTSGRWNVRLGSEKHDLSRCKSRVAKSRLATVPVLKSQKLTCDTCRDVSQT